jgi:RNase H
MTDYNASGRLLAWALELSKFDISFHPRTALKSQILTDFIADYSGLKRSKEDEWALYVDEASSQQGSRAGIVMTSLQGDMLNYTLHLMYYVTNNIAEYEAMIVSLKLVKELIAREVWLYSDSQLTV